MQGPLPSAPAVASGLASVLYLTNQAVDSTTDLPAGAHHICCMSLRPKPRSPHAVTDREPWPPTFAWKGVCCRLTGNDSWVVPLELWGWQGEDSLGTQSNHNRGAEERRPSHLLLPLDLSHFVLGVQAVLLL